MFNNSYIMMNDNSPFNCGSKCREANYTYFGLEFARECWCGNVLNFRIPKPNEECEVCNHENCHTNNLGNKKCPGDLSQGCGNAYRMRLFQWAGTAPSDIEGYEIIITICFGMFSHSIREQIKRLQDLESSLQLIKASICIYQTVFSPDSLLLSK